MQYSDAFKEATYVGYDPYNSLDKVEEILFTFAEESARCWVPSDAYEPCDLVWG